MHIFWARLASLGQLGLISDPLIVSKFHNETHDPKGQEIKIYTIVKACRRSTAATQSQSPAGVKSNMFLKWVSFVSKECKVFASKGYPFKNIFDFTTASDLDAVAAVERLPALHYSVDFFSCPLGSWASLWNFETIRGSLMKPKWHKLASLAQKICTL